jgi:eukaryotic-like serine/threonine-protein kinase
MNGWQDPTDEVLVAASLAERRRRRRRAVASTSALLVGVVVIGGAFGGLVYAARRAAEGFADLEFNLDLPTPTRQASFAPEVVGRTPHWSALASPFSSAPTVAEGRVFVREQGGAVTAYDAASGARLWSAFAGGGPVGYDFPPVVDRGVVYVAGGRGMLSSSGDVFALDAATGAVRWTVSIPGFGGYPIAVDGEDVYVDGPHLLALDRASGARRWELMIGNLSDGGYSRPAVDGDTVYVGGGDGRVYAVNRATGSTRWSTPVGAAGFSSAGPTVSVAGSLVYAVSKDAEVTAFGDATVSGHVRALDSATGEERWSQHVDGLRAFGSGPLVSGTTVYVASSTLGAYDAATGVPRWTAPTGGTSLFSFTPPVLELGTVYVAGGDGRLHAVDATSGRTIWTAGVGAPCSEDEDCPPLVAVPPAAANGVLYLASGDSRLYAYAP